VAYNSYNVYPVGAGMLRGTALAYGRSFKPAGPNLPMVTVPLLMDRRRAVVPGKNVPPWPHLITPPPPPPPVIP
jgi:hypothetical protein